MNIFKKIKEFFSPSGFYSAENLTFDNPSFEFKRIDNLTIESITHYLNQYLLQADKIESEDLIEKESFVFLDIQDLLAFVREALEFDYAIMIKEKWEFEYFINHYFLDKSTISIYNRFTNSNPETGHMILTLISIRKYNDKFYCWLNIDDYEPAGNSR